MGITMSYRVLFADGGEVTIEVEEAGTNAGWVHAVQKATDMKYNGRRRQVAQITATRVPQWQVEERERKARERETEATQNLVADMERDGLL